MHDGYLGESPESALDAIEHLSNNADRALPHLLIVILYC